MLVLGRCSRVLFESQLIVAYWCRRYIFRGSGVHVMAVTVATSELVGTMLEAGVYGKCPVVVFTVVYGVLIVFVGHRDILHCAHPDPLCFSHAA